MANCLPTIFSTTYFSFSGLGWFLKSSMSFLMRASTARCASLRSFVSWRGSAGFETVATHSDLFWLGTHLQYTTVSIEHKIVYYSMNVYTDNYDSIPFLYGFHGNGYGFRRRLVSTSEVNVTAFLDVSSHLNGCDPGRKHLTKA